MAYDTNEIQARVASLVDQSTTPPTAGGAEWNLRLKYINRAYEEWANAYEWEALRQTQYSTVTASASISLPGNFHKMAAFPLLYNGVTGGEEWPEIQPNEKKLYSDTDKYFYLLGNRGNGFTMVWNPGTLASGASLFIQYYSFPSSLASPADVPVIPDPEFLVERSIAYVFESRSDARFQEIEAKAREKLLLMVDNENAKARTYKNTIETPERLYFGFRFGRD